MSGALALLLSGLVVTLKLTVAGSALALGLGFAAGLSLLARDPILRAVARTYVELFRGTSALVQLYFLYYVVPQLLSVDVSAMSAGILVLGLNTGAYAAEVVRAGLGYVPAEQDEAASCLGLSAAQSLRLVLLPQALPSMLPPLTTLLVELLKASSLVSLVTLTDLTFAADLIRADTLQTGLVYGLVLVVYFVAASLLSLAGRALEQRLSRFRPATEAVR